MKQIGFWINNIQLIYKPNVAKVNIFIWRKLNASHISVENDLEFVY